MIAAFVKIGTADGSRTRTRPFDRQSESLVGYHYPTAALENLEVEQTLLWSTPPSFGFLTSAELAPTWGLLLIKMASRTHVWIVIIYLLAVDLLTVGAFTLKWSGWSDSNRRQRISYPPQRIPSAPHYQAMATPWYKIGAEGEIRTHEDVTIPAYKAGAIDHYATSAFWIIVGEDRISSL